MQPPSSADLTIVERVVRRHLGAPITAVRRIASSVNEVVVVSCGEQQLVVRLNVASEMDRFQKEAWCIERSAESGVPGPSVRALGIEGDRAFMIESYIAGNRGDIVPPPARPAMWHDLGGHLRRIHAIPVRGFGDKAGDLTDNDSAAGWRRYLEYNRSSLTGDDPLLALRALDRDAQGLLGRVFEDLAALPLRFGLSHGDPSPWNVIVGDGGRLHLIDWGEAHAHVIPHFDLGVILSGRLDERSPEFDALLAGYGLGHIGYGAIRREIMALRLLIATDKVRWALDRKPEHLPEKVETLRSLLRDWSDA